MARLEDMPEVERTRVLAKPCTPLRSVLLRLFSGVLAVSSLVIALGAPASGEVLYVDEQFGFTQSTVVFASKPVGLPPGTLDLPLELCQPQGAGVPTPRPAVILIHGGGFTGGSRFNARMLEMCERMARRGYTAVSIDYRLQGDDPVVSAPFAPIEAAITAAGDSRGAAIAGAVEDGWAAREWMTANAATLGVDPDRIGVAGGSAGAIISLMLGYVLPEMGVAPTDAFGAVFDMWGTLGDSPTSLSSGDPPLLIAHGENDPTVPVSGAYALETQAIAVGLTHEVYVLEGVGHGFDIFTRVVAPGQTMFDRFVYFFYEHVAGASTVSVPALSPVAKSLLPGFLAVLGLIGLRGRRKRI